MIPMNIPFGRIHNVHLYARVSNSYPDRSARTIEPMDVYPMTLPRILTGELSSKAGEVAAPFYFAMLHLITLCSLLQKNEIQLLLYR